MLILYYFQVKKKKFISSYCHCRHGVKMKRIRGNRIWHHKKDVMDMIVLLFNSILSYMENAKKWASEQNGKQNTKFNLHLWMQRTSKCLQWIDVEFKTLVRWITFSASLYLAKCREILSLDSIIHLNAGMVLIFIMKEQVLRTRYVDTLKSLIIQCCKLG